MSKIQGQKSHQIARTGSYATRGSGTGISRLDWHLSFPETMTPEQKYEAAKTAYKSMMKRREELKAVGRMPKILFEEYEEIGQRIQELLPQMSEFRKQLHKTKTENLSEFILLVVKNRMTAFEWSLLVKDAEELQRKHPNIVLGKEFEKK